MKTPNGKTNMLELQSPMIENAPSFALFNNSFESLNDPAKLGMTMSGGLGISPSFSFGLGVPSIKSRDERERTGPYPESNNSLRLSGSGGSIGGFDPSNDAFGVQRPSSKDAKTMVLGGAPGSSNPFGSDARRGAAIVLSGTSSGDGSAAALPGRARSGSSATMPFLLRKVEFGQRSVKDFYDVLRSHKLAFEDCTFLLPGLKEALGENSEKEAKAGSDGVPSSANAAAAATAAASTPPRSTSPKAKSPRSESASPDRGAGGDVESPKSHIICTPARSQRSTHSKDSLPSADVVARRRVKSAVCAFGGSGYATEQPKEEHIRMTDKDEDGDEGEARVKGDAPDSGDSKSSIFRTKKEEDHADTPSVIDEKEEKDATSGHAGEDKRSKARKLYDEKLPDRFYENDDRLSWEIEDDPPIDDDEANDDAESSGEKPSPSRTSSSESNKRSYPGGSGGMYHSDRDAKKMRPPFKADGVMMMPHHEAMSKARAAAAFAGSPQPKMRYRCKLCGQPKQNHSCPYQQSLQRSIGTMVYKAVNSYTAEEPGEVAPALSAMNNFISPSGGGESEPSSAATTPSRGGPKTATIQRNADRRLAHITPQSLRAGVNSPGGSSLSTIESPRGVDQGARRFAPADGPLVHPAEAAVRGALAALAALAAAATILPLVIFVDQCSRGCDSHLLDLHPPGEATYFLLSRRIYCLNNLELSVLVTEQRNQWILLISMLLFLSHTDSERGSATSSSVYRRRFPI